MPGARRLEVTPSFGFHVNVLPESWYTDAEAAADEAALAAHVAAAAPAPAV